MTFTIAFGYWLWPFGWTLLLIGWALYNTWSVRKSRAAHNPSNTVYAAAISNAVDSALDGLAFMFFWGVAIILSLIGWLIWAVLT